MLSCSATLLFLTFFCSVTDVLSWDNDEMELFDLVEEVNKSFYELLGVDQVVKTILTQDQVFSQAICSYFSQNTQSQDFLRLSCKKSSFCKYKCF